ncbi:hypothetical protein DHOM_02745 [Dermabacter hominis 1368]|uniref:Uncharacterized protein n=1 Tax=Dermabacter hominis 1368 TaxID=1450519 RepID=A0ABR4SM42_9MICO|nr:hypothetical protein DHOM_02745 [Dermabacter hominis 1368]
MTKAYRLAEEAILDEIIDMVDDARKGGCMSAIQAKGTEYVTALALHRLANAWERRVEIAEATAKQKGVIE